MFRYSKAVIYTIVLILACGLIPVWSGIDPMFDRVLILRMTTGCCVIIAYLLYRHHVCTQLIVFEKEHFFLGRKGSRMYPESDYPLVYRSTYLVFAGIGWFAREWQPRTGMMVFRKNRRYIPGMSLFDRVFPGSSAVKQVVFLGAWKQPSGEIASDNLEQQMQSYCVRDGISVKTVWVELEIFLYVLGVALLAIPFF